MLRGVVQSCETVRQGARIYDERTGGIPFAVFSIAGRSRGSSWKRPCRIRHPPSLRIFRYIQSDLTTISTVENTCSLHHEPRRSPSGLPFQPSSVSISPHVAYGLRGSSSFGCCTTAACRPLGTTLEAHRNDGGNDCVLLVPFPGFP